MNFRIFRASSKTFLERLFIALSLLVYFGFTAPTQVYGMNPEQQRLFDKGVDNFNLDQDVYCSSNGSTGGAALPGGAGTTAELDARQEAIAKTIIGIAKTYNLGEGGAVIGIMAGLTESHLQMYASTVIPLSRTNPAWLAIPEPERPLGSDHDSLGVMQQRISTEWSTISTDSNNRDAVFQLMDPAYNAQAFYGTPPGANLSSIQPESGARALKKGLMNQANWQSMDPWVAAQKVQRSAYSDGSNYKRYYEQAQTIVQRFYADAPALPLPVPIDGSAGAGGGATAAGGGGCSPASTGDTKGITDWALRLSWEDGSHGLTPKPEYEQAINQHNPGGIGNFNGADCGAFVATVLRASGADPEYPPVGTSVQTDYLIAHPEKWQSVPNLGNTSNLQPGDVFIIERNGGGSGHTFVYTGTQPNGTNIAQASLGSDQPYQSSVYFTDDRGTYNIYRLK